ncbi:right-handed parallel beta-helix repeat-containing protein [Rubellicoccus peritrichatus]|uniref:Right-handed parallel beta-helix repeat-containing protein n=1 Tax=Rubellicoccus peritrichatus TaxID=3080537 RepID=A0AAQ3L9V3_9BACT|nr:NosD domain-containing protein [Puniceicoccus sp. CR14]WOO39538.1 right-handed parallel beta-helix repeat-containing protein [Puniceicoccus sp. CR14]
MNHSSLSFYLTRAILAAVLMIPVFGRAQADWNIDFVSPALAEHGETVTLTGTGFDTGATYTVMVGTLPATVTNLTTTTIEFTAPVGFTAAPIIVSDGERTITAPDPLTPLRGIAGTINLPPGVNEDAYDIMAGLEIVKADSDGNFAFTMLPANKVLITIAYNPQSEDDPAFFGIIPPNQNNFELNAESTAATLAILNPGLMTSDPAGIDQRVQAIKNQSQFPQIVDLIEAISAPGVDYMLDGRLQTHLESVINGAVTDLQAPVAPLVSSGLRISNSTVDAGNDNVSFTGGEIIRKNQTFDRSTPVDRLSLRPVTNTKKREVEIEVKADIKGFQPVDWYVEVYRIDPGLYQNLTEARTLPGDFEPRLLNNQKPIFSSYVRADLITARLDIIEVIATWLTEKATKLASPSTTFTLSLDDPGLYVVQAYSGNIFYGIKNFLPNPSSTDQADLLVKYDVNGLWKWAGASNALAITIDYVSALTSAKDLLKTKSGSLLDQKKLIDDFSTIYETILVNFGKTIALASSETEAGPSSRKRTEEVFLQVLQSKLQVIFNLILNGIDDQIKCIASPAGFKQSAGIGFKKFLKAVDVVGKVSSFAQATQRLDGLLGGNTRALERSLVVIDNPFRPFVTSVSPGRGRSGTVISILGDNFTDDDGTSRILSVSFCAFPNGDTSQEPDRELAATILSVESGIIRAQVPDTWELEFGDERGASICVETFDGDEFNSGRLRGQFGFNYIPDIEVVRIGFNQDNSVQANQGSLEIFTNTLFDSEVRDIEVHVFDASNNDLTPNGAEIISVNTSSITIKFDSIAPNLDPDDPPVTMSATVQAKVRIHDPEQVSFTEEVRPLNPVPFSFTVNPVPEPMLGGGLIMQVSSLSNVIAEDGELTLIEALIIASEGIAGLPGRTVLEGPAICETPSALISCPQVARDYDHILNPSALTLENNPTDETTPTQWSGGGLLGRDRIVLNENLRDLIDGGTNLVWTPDRALPPLTSGDEILLSDLIIDGTNAGSSPALRFDGVQGVKVQEVTFRNFSGDGAVFSSTNVDEPSTDNLLFRVNFNSMGGRGVAFEGHANANTLRAVRVNGTVGDALLFDGPGASNNIVEPNISFDFSKFNQFSGSTSGYGVHVKGGATSNNIRFNEASNNSLGGIRIDGAAHNTILGADEGAFAFSSSDNIVSNNSGHGIHIAGDSAEILMRYCDIYNNAGDGIRIDGADSVGHKIIGVRTGVGIDEFFEEFRSPNTGNGLYIGGGASFIFIGSSEKERFPPGFLGTGGNDDRNYFYANEKNGIHIEGPDSHGCFIQTTYVGGSTFGIDRTNGENNLLINNGSRENEIGDIASMWVTISESTQSIIQLQRTLACSFRGASDGAGILLDNAHDNIIVGCDFAANKVGIHLRNGSSGNEIGMPGDINDLNFEEIVLGNVFSPEESTILYRPFNFIYSNTEASIWVEGSGATIEEDGTVTNPNIFEGNMIGIRDERQGSGNVVNGLKITGASYGNIFGGDDPLSANRFSGANEAGVLIDGVSYPTPEHRNRFLNNTFIFNGLFRRGDYDARTFTPPGIGLLLRNCDKIIFGEDLNTPNHFKSNNFGVYLENTTNSIIQGNIIEDSRNVGHVIRGGSNNRVGGSQDEPSNFFINNGDTDFTRDGALMLASTSGNQVVGNLFGEIEEKERTPTDRRLGNKGSSIYLFNSANNIIGDPYQNGGNTIVQNEGPGIHLDGSGSINNRIINNRIGALNEHEMSADEDYLANDGIGIILENGASNNTIGGRAAVDIKGSMVELPMRNTIARSGGAGVQVNGASTTGNTITNNSITGNTGLGIQLLNGGNGNQGVPTTCVYDGETLSSTTPDLVNAPPGSIIQVFSDSASGSAEGFSFIGETTVRDDGTWEVSGLSYLGFAGLSVTVTNPTTGSTSGFGEVAINPQYNISRSDNGTPGASTFASDRTTQTVLSLDVGAQNTRVTFSRMTFTASGNIDESAIVNSVEVYWDADDNGILSSGDVLLGGPTTFASNDGTVAVDLNNPTLNPGETQTWLVVYKMADTITNGDDLILELAASTNVVATLPASGVAASPTTGSTFPITSDTLTAGPSAYAIWVAANFPGQESNLAISGQNADPDLDNRLNLLEYVQDTDPNSSDFADSGQLLLVGNELFYEFTRKEGRSDYDIRPKVMFTLGGFGFGHDLFGDPTVTSNGDGTETLRYKAQLDFANYDSIFTELNLAR